MTPRRLVPAFLLLWTVVATATLGAVFLEQTAREDAPPEIPGTEVVSVLKNPNDLSGLETEHSLPAGLKADELWMLFRVRRAFVFRASPSSRSDELVTERRAWAILWQESAPGPDTEALISWILRSEYPGNEAKSLRDGQKVENITARTSLVSLQEGDETRIRVFATPDGDILFTHTGMWKALSNDPSLTSTIIHILENPRK